AEFLLHLEKALRVRDRGLDLQLVADDAGICEQPLYRARVEARHPRGVETGERAAVARPLAQHGAPAQARLGRLEDQELVMLVVVVDRNTPFPIVIVEVFLVDAFAPWATDDARHDGSLGPLVSTCGAAGAPRDPGSFEPRPTKRQRRNRPSCALPRPV